MKIAPANDRGDCPICGVPSVLIAGTNPDFSPSVILKCNECELWHTSPGPTSIELADIYKETYRSIRKESPTSGYISFMDTRAEAQFEFISSASSERFVSSRVLDIGCGVGSLLKTFEHRGSCVTGYEPDAIMATAAAERLTSQAVVSASLFEPAEWSGEPFDLICMSHVFEHVPDPLAFLRELFRITRSGGMLFLEVPNETERTIKLICDRNMRGLMHLTFFNTRSLESAVVHTGWLPLRCEAFGPDSDAWVDSFEREISFPARLTNKLKRILKKLGYSSSNDAYSSHSRSEFFRPCERGEWARIVVKKP